MEGKSYSPGHCASPSERVDLKALELPLLPGMSMHDPYQRDFNKAHAFGFSRTPLGPMGYTDMYDERKMSLRHMPQAHVATLRQDPNQPKIPAFVALDRKVLSFDAYFREAVPESNLERDRVRHVQIYYYLEDGSISINEKCTEDSGMKQGYVGAVVHIMATQNIMQEDAQTDASSTRWILRRGVLWAC
jgi:hypothetical protein